MLKALALVGGIASAAIPVKLIIDTDIGGGGCKDVDDVAAICIANALVDNGEAELLAVVHNTYFFGRPGPCLIEWYGCCSTCCFDHPLC